MKAILALGVAALCATSAMAAKDDFNRRALGNKWVVPYGNLYITDDRLQGDSDSLGYFNPSSNDLKATVTVYINGTDVEYGAVAIGDIASGNNAFVKIQSQNGDGMFHDGAFYLGNNTFCCRSFALRSPVSSPATLSVSLCGMTAVMKITDASGHTQKYKYTYGLDFGTGGGLGTYGNVSLDNYKSGPATCKDAIDAISVTKSDVRDLSR